MLWRVLFWAAAGILLVSGLFATFSYVETVASSDLRGRCEEVYLEAFENGEVLTARRQWFPPAISCRVRFSSSDEVSRATRPTGAISFFMFVLSLDVGAATLVAAGVRNPPSKRRARSRPSVSYD